MALTPEQSKYYDNMDEMFGTVGWRTLMEEMAREIYQLQADALDIKPIPGVSTDFLLGKLQGKAEQLAYMLRLEEVSDAQKAALENDDGDE